MRSITIVIETLVAYQKLVLVADLFPVLVLKLACEYRFDHPVGTDLTPSRFRFSCSFQSIALAHVLQVCILIGVVWFILIQPFRTRFLAIGKLPMSLVIGKI